MTRNIKQLVVQLRRARERHDLVAVILLEQRLRQALAS